MTPFATLPFTVLSMRVEGDVVVVATTGGLYKVDGTGNWTCPEFKLDQEVKATNGQSQRTAEG